MVMVVKSVGWSSSSSSSSSSSHHHHHYHPREVPVVVESLRLQDQSDHSHHRLHYAKLQSRLCGRWWLLVVVGGR